MAETKKTAEVKEAPPAEVKTDKKGAEPTFKFRAPIDHDYAVLLHNIITEKSQKLSVDGNVIALRVQKNASKPAIKDAVQAVFGVKVKKVNTVNVPPKKRSARRGKQGAYKKAYVFVDKAYNLGQIANAVAAPDRK